jgi:biopolymer transport protein TolQ
MGTAPNVRICAAAIDELKRASGDSPITQMGRVQMKMNHTSRNESAKLHRGMNILASIASATPFIGLFGTVLGIMHTFQVLGTAKSASLNVVAPGIAAALIATAAGLAVAIPAVFLYNALMARMDELQDQADMFVETLGQRLSAGEAMGPPPTTRAFERHVTEPVIIGEGAHVPGATL